MKITVSGIRVVANISYQKMVAAISLIVSTTNRLVSDPLTFDDAVTISKASPYFAVQYVTGTNYAQNVTAYTA